MATVEERLAVLEAWKISQELNPKPQGFDWTPFLKWVPSKFQGFVAAVLMALAGSGAWYIKPTAAQVAPTSNDKSSPETLPVPKATAKPQAKTQE